MGEKRRLSQMNEINRKFQSDACTSDTYTRCCVFSVRSLVFGLLFAFRSSPLFFQLQAPLFIQLDLSQYFRLLDDFTPTPFEASEEFKFGFQISKSSCFIKIFFFFFLRRWSFLRFLRYGKWATGRNGHSRTDNRPGQVMYIYMYVCM